MQLPILDRLILRLAAAAERVFGDPRLREDRACGGDVARLGVVAARGERDLGGGESERVGCARVDEFQRLERLRRAAIEDDACGIAAHDRFTAAFDDDKGPAVRGLLDAASQHADQGIARRHPPMEPRPGLPW